MKTFLNFLLIIFFSIPIFSQKSTVISGPCTLLVNQQVTYSVPSGIAQCADCYDWDINNTDLTTSGNVQIIGSDQNSTVTIKALSSGSFTLKVTYFNETGCHTLNLNCQGGVTIIPDCTFTIAIDPNYTISGGSMTFQALTTPALPTGVTYNWTVTYQDGFTDTFSSNATNYATFGFSPLNGIVNVSVHATYVTCTADDDLNIPCTLPTPDFNVYKIENPHNYWLAAIPNSGPYTFTWIVTYYDGSVLNFTGANTYSVPYCNNSNSIQSIQLIISNAICSKTVTKYYQKDTSCSQLRLIQIKNPIKEKLELLLSNPNMKFTGKILDFNGNVIHTFDHNTYNNLDLSLDNKSINIIKIFDEDNVEILSEKIIK